MFPNREGIWVRESDEYRIRYIGTQLYVQKIPFDSSWTPLSLLNKVVPWEFKSALETEIIKIPIKHSNIPTEPGLYFHGDILVTVRGRDNVLQWLNGNGLWINVNDTGPWSNRIVLVNEPRIKLVAGQQWKLNSRICTIMYDCVRDRWALSSRGNIICAVSDESAWYTLAELETLLNNKGKYEGTSTS